MSGRAPDVSGSCVKLSTPLHFHVEAPDGAAADVSLPLAGLYNVYNALAATAGGLACGLPLPSIAGSFAEFDAVFGRQEEMQVRGRRVRILLCKNPAGANQVLRLLAAEEQPHYLLLLLNDATADGHDVSWIWDVDYEMLAGRVEAVGVSGRRAPDMALRLKYAGYPVPSLIEENEQTAVDQAIALTPPGGCLTVLPTYTAMLTVRERLAALAGRSRFWQD